MEDYMNWTTSTRSSTSPAGTLVISDAFMGDTTNAITDDDEKTNPATNVNIGKPMSPFSALFSSDMLDESGVQLSESTANQRATDIISKKLLDGEMKCAFCPFTCNDHSQLMKHRRSHTGVKIVACPDCPASFTRLSTFKQHHLKKHQNSYKCTIPKCNYMSISVEALELHKRSKHSLGSGAYYCKACEARYRLRSSLLNHLTRSHNGNAALIGIGEEIVHEDNTQQDVVQFEKSVDAVVSPHKKTISVVTIVKDDDASKDVTVVSETIISPNPSTSAELKSPSAEDKRGRLRPRTSTDSTKSPPKKNSKGGKTLFACDRCKYTAKTFRALFSHKKGKHPPNEVTSPHCVFCWKKFPSVDRLMSHIRREHIVPQRKKASRAYTCVHCSFNTTTKRVFTAHKNMHAQEVNKRNKGEASRRVILLEESSREDSVSPQSLGTGPHTMGIGLPPAVPLDLSGVVERTPPEMESAMMHMQEANRQLMQLCRRRETEMAQVKANAMRLVELCSPGHPQLHAFRSLPVSQFSTALSSIINSCLDQLPNIINQSPT